MAEATQISFKTEELLELLVKGAGVHEGNWTLRLELGFVAGAFPLSPNEAMPGGAVIVQNIGIQKASPPAAGQIPVPFVDAAKVNPKSGAK